MISSFHSVHHTLVKGWNPNPSCDRVQERQASMSSILTDREHNFSWVTCVTVVFKCSEPALKFCYVYLFKK